MLMDKQPASLVRKRSSAALAATGAATHSTAGRARGRVAGRVRAVPLAASRATERRSTSMPPWIARARTAVAMVVLFPLGSILMRILPGRWAIWVHGLAQVASLTVYIAAVGLGIYLVQMVQIPNGGSLVRHPKKPYIVGG